MSGPRRLYLPEPVTIADDGRGRPLTIDGQPVEAIRESWLVEDRWWTAQPLRRRYWEVVTSHGERFVVFRELSGRGWFRHGGGVL